MGKGGIILGLIGILLGAGGLGFGIMAWNNQNIMQANFSVPDIWYQYDGDSFQGNPIDTYLHIPNMSIVFDLATTASIHILFMCRAIIYPIPTDYSGMSFYFNIDGIRLTEPRADVGSYEGISTVDYYSVALQHFIPSFSSGTHNISVMVYSESNPNWVWYCSLTIQSLAD